MGNICGKEDPEPQPPNRILATAPPSQRKSSLPASRHKVGGPPRTLGTAGTATQTQGEGEGEGAAGARRKAADAAEARAKASAKSGGKLQSQLAAQKRQSRNDVLRTLGDDQRRHREIAQNDESRTYN